MEIHACCFVGIVTTNHHLTKTQNLKKHNKKFQIIQAIIKGKIILYTLFHKIINLGSTNNISRISTPQNERYPEVKSTC